MLGKTHAVAGVTTALLFAPPTFIGIGSGILFGCLGGLLPDVDSKQSIASKKLNIVTKITAIAAILFIILLYCTSNQTTNLFGVKNQHITIITRVVSFLILLCFCIVGSKTPHRSFTHSLEFVSLAALCMYFIYAPATIPFALGLLSHIALDLFNKKKLSLVWSLHYRVCFGLVSANGAANDVLYFLSIVLSIVVLVHKIIF